ncbi:MAG TPA: isocitrate/isopropylmalate family dehydrogenase, partial [Candidatus Nitrosotenuis sp.]|nr:isocitrate/isopropylmalate family dehydrogenase [Candidatus Nitrosotenuis sp.]
MYKIALITGDGIGPDLSESVLSVLDSIHDKFGLKLEVKQVPAGDAALAKLGNALPNETIDVIKNSDACLKA